MQVATDVDGNILDFDATTQLFQLDGDPVEVADVAAFDGAGLLVWTRPDVQYLVQQSAKRGVSIGDVKLPGHIKLAQKLLAAAESTESFADKLGTSSGSYDLTYGKLNPGIVCPQCQMKGAVRTKSVKQKRGVSGGKATAAVLTGGLSVLATGLSRKEQSTQAYCARCRSTWHY